MHQLGEKTFKQEDEDGICKLFNQVCQRTVSEHTKTQTGFKNPHPVLKGKEKRTGKEKHLYTKLLKEEICVKK